MNQIRVVSLLSSRRLMPRHQAQVTRPQPPMRHPRLHPRRRRQGVHTTTTAATSHATSQAVPTSAAARRSHNHHGCDFPCDIPGCTHVGDKAFTKPPRPRLPMRRHKLLQHSRLARPRLPMRRHKLLSPARSCFTFRAAADFSRAAGRRRRTTEASARRTPQPEFIH